MRALLSVMAAAGFALTGCAARPARAVQAQKPSAAQQAQAPKRLGDAYPLERIILTTLKDAHFEQLPEKPVPVPQDLAETLKNHYTYAVKLEDPAGFERDILAELAKRGIPEDRIAGLGPRRLVELSYTIICDRLTYHLVDNDKEFKDGKGNIRPIDYYFRRGKGDCDKYRDLTIAAYNILKARAPAATNLYLGSQELGGEFFMHAWPTAILLFPDKAEIAHFDPTFHDGGGQLEGKAGQHHMPDRFHARVFSAVKDLDRAIACFSAALAKAREAQDRAELYRERAFCEYLKNDCEAVLRTRAAFESERLKPFHDAILYYAGQALSRAGRRDESWKARQELVEKYPDSIWIRNIRD
jgi:hypothetical protein